MMSRRSVQIVTIAAAFLAPLAALAQTASVTVAPIDTAAPAVSTLMLGLLAVVLTVAAAVVLRRRSAMVGSGLALAIAAVTVVGIGHAAFTDYTIEGNECTQQTTEDYFPGGAPRLLSACPNPIRIIGFAIQCNGTGGEVPSESLDACVFEQILHLGDDCALPICMT